MTAASGAPDDRTIDSSPAEVAEAWIADDPDPRGRAELRALLDAGNHRELADRFRGSLHFGTAGLRGSLGAGPTRMNMATVRRASAGLAAYLADSVPRAAAAGVVVGYDARHGSERFADETARVISGAGLRVLRLPGQLPTPLLAFAVRHLACAAGVMITASHNPPQDNGYKVYLGNGAQIVPPADDEISAAIGKVGPLAQVPLGDCGQPVGAGIVDEYLEAVIAALPAIDTHDIRAVYTPLHGVGCKVLLAAFDRAGFASPHVVPLQAEPDPDFPTLPKPNPEEPGALDLAIAEADAVSADLVLANDPDADRLAIAIPSGAEPSGWRVLRGDEVGRSLATTCSPGPRTGTTPRSPPPSCRQACSASSLMPPERITPRRSPASNGSCTRRPAGLISASFSATRRRSATQSTTSCATRMASPLLWWWQGSPQKQNVRDGLSPTGSTTSLAASGSTPPTSLPSSYPERPEQSESARS